MDWVCRGLYDDAKTQRREKWDDDDGVHGVKGERKDYGDD